MATDQDSVVFCYLFRSAWCGRRRGWQRVWRGKSAVQPPRAVRQTLLYRLMVENTLQFLIQEVGEVEGVYDDAQPLAERFAIRRAASHGIEAAGILAFHASPGLGAGGSGRSVRRRQVSDSGDFAGIACRRAAVVEQDHPFESVDQLLDGLEKSVGHLAQAANSPPLNIQGNSLRMGKIT